MDALKSYYEISPFFFLITASATLLYVTMNVIMIFGGPDIDDLPSDASFKFFSTQTVLAFFMGFGWGGITCTTKWQLPFWQSTLLAILAGALLMNFTAFLLFRVRNLNHTPVKNIYTSVGSKGKVYTAIPVTTDGEGKIQVVVSGSLQIVSAVSADEAIESFSEVEVVGIKDKNTVIVKKIVRDTSDGESA